MLVCLQISKQNRSCWSSKKGKKKKGKHKPNTTNTLVLLVEYTKNRINQRRNRNLYGVIDKTGVGKPTYQEN